MTEGIFADWRSGQRAQHTLTAVLRQSVFSRLEGYEATGDAGRLSMDSAVRHVFGGRVTRRRRQHRCDDNDAYNRRN